MHNNFDIIPELSNTDYKLTSHNKTIITDNIRSVSLAIVQSLLYSISPRLIIILYLFVCQNEWRLILNESEWMVLNKDTSKGCILTQRYVSLY